MQWLGVLSTGVTCHWQANLGDLGYSVRNMLIENGLNLSSSRLSLFVY